jgi:RHS repeat-associated protein
LLLIGFGLSPVAIAQTTVTYIHTDALGSVVAESDANGNVIKRYDYEPYGAVVGGQATDGPGYTGHVSDSATGLNYMQQRYMDPQLGVFLSVDPVAAYSNPIGQFNRYRYANSNPYKFTDPDGRQSIAACGMNPANAAACAEAGIATGGGASGAGGTSGGGGVIAGILSALGLERLVQRSDSAGSAADKIKEGTSPSTGSKSGNGDVHPGGQEAADAAWDSINGVGETKRYEDRHGNVTEVKDLDGGGVADRHTSTKSDHKGAPTIKIRDAESKVIQTTRYEKSQ